MATLTDFTNPSFVLYPVNNNRTAWRPVSFPVILVVPHRRDPAGITLNNSEIFNVRIFIENVPQASLVAGPQHIGQRFPDRELYAVNVDALMLAERQIDPNDLTISRNGQPLDINDAQTGDLLHYTTATGVTDTIPYLIGADYYDLSDILIDVELLPSDNYNLIYQTGYFNRVISTDGGNDFLCIDLSTTAIAILKFTIAHPGAVLDEFYRLTPPPYVTNTSKALDTTVALYRPFTDVLQDITDEQGLLESINWVFDTPAEAIPYLSALLGWDIPYFPASLDQLRRAVLRRTVEFQNLKGSRRVIINIFRLFGFEILISNLWWSADGQRLIRPDEALPPAYQDQTITTIRKNQVDLLLNNYQIADFTTLAIPLLFRSQELAGLDQFTALHDGGQLTLTVYAVNPGGPADLALSAISAQIVADPAGYGGQANCSADANGFLFPMAVDTALTGLPLAGYSQIHIAGSMGAPVDETLVGPVIPVLSKSVQLNRETNTLTFTLNGFTQLQPYRLYALITYQRFEFLVPDILANLQSNRFDLQVLTQALDEIADPTTLDFAIDFLYKLKAFHSLLNVIRTSIELTETYEVTALCVGGDFTQRFDTDIGRLQVPPAVIPSIPGDNLNCTLFDPHSLGYKDADLLLRARKLANLPEEHAAWRALDNRDQVLPGTTQITPTAPAPGRTECKFNPSGQDRIIVQPRPEQYGTEIGPSQQANSEAVGLASTLDLAPNAGHHASTNSDSSTYGTLLRQFTAISEPFCTLDRVTDYCYKGRVDDELLYRPTMLQIEHSQPHPIYFSLGLGVYWLYPVQSVTTLVGVRQPDGRGQTNRMHFSGNAPDANQYYYQRGIQNSYLTVAYDRPLPPQNNSFMGRLYRDYDSPPEQTLHYSNRSGDPIIDQRYQLALQRPSLEVHEPILHFPGCRFPTLNRLKTDYISNYMAKPWDATVCGPRNICGHTDPDFLHVHKVIGSDGSEQLVFDQQQFTVLGNNLEPDISSLGVQTVGTEWTETAVVHEVYMGSAEGNPAIALENVCQYSTGSSSGGTIPPVTGSSSGATLAPYDAFPQPNSPFGFFPAFGSIAAPQPTAASDGLLITNNPLFTSACRMATQFTDFADGYPCLSGFLPYQPSDPTIYDDLLAALDLPPGAASGTPYLFRLSSGLRDGSMGLRLDGGCSVADCGPTAAQTPLCALTQYLDEDGFYDFEPDHLQADVRLLMVEELTVVVTQLDGTIPSLLETL